MKEEFHMYPIVNLLIPRKFFFEDFEESVVLAGRSLRGDELLLRILEEYRDEACAKYGNYFAYNKIYVCHRTTNELFKFEMLAPLKELELICIEDETEEK